MNDSLEIQKVRLQASIYSLALYSIYSVLSSSQRETVIKIFRSSTEQACLRLQDEEFDEEGIQLFLEICKKIERELIGR